MGNGADFGEFHLHLFNTCLNKARVARVVTFEQIEPIDKN